MLETNRKLVIRNSNTTIFKVRNTYTRNIKENAIRLMKVYGISTVCSKTNIPLTCLRRWEKQGPERREGSGRRPFWEELEEILFDWFVKQREDAKLITLKSVQRQGLKIFEENYKEEGKEFKCSIGWIQNWKK